MTQTAIEQRSERAQNLKIFRIDSDKFFVESSEGKICYKVSLKDGICTCGDFTSNIQKDQNFRCKHLIAAMNSNGNYEQLSFPIQDKPKLDKSFITSIQGRDFVKYARLSHKNLIFRNMLSNLSILSVKFSIAS
jgi:predicted nucleic acid-binding Zn finger protein